MNPKLRAWLQLFRAPNLFTVPGDPLAGFIIISGGWLNPAVIPAIVASLCFYAAGLVMNDIADLAEDQRDRPKRPLASGMISVIAAKMAVLALVGIGLGVLWLAATAKTALVGAGIVVSVTLYNYLTKKVPVIGAMNMGVCRMLSIVLGGFAAGAETESNPLRVVALMVSAASIGFYIMAITQLSRFETKSHIPNWAKFLPLLALFAGYILIKQFSGPVFLDAAPALWVMALIMTVGVTFQMTRSPVPPLPPKIGALIRVLLILQAALVALPSVEGPFPKTWHSLVAAFLLLMAFPLSTWVGKRFYAS